jgi:hypothetical protein
MDLKIDCVDWIRLSQDRCWCRIASDTTINLRKGSENSSQTEGLPVSENEICSMKLATVKLLTVS